MEREARWQMDIIKKCEDCEEVCSRPKTKRKNGFCTRIVRLPDHWEVIRMMQQKGYYFTEEMVFQLQKRGLGPFFYLQDNELHKLWEIRAGRAGRAQITIHSAAMCFFLSSYIDLSPLSVGKQNKSNFDEGQLVFNIDPEPFEWKEKPHLIGFFNNGPFFDQIADIEKGFFSIHLLANIPRGEISKQRKKLAEELRLRGKKEADRNSFFKILFKILSKEKTKSSESYLLISKLYKRLSGIEITPDAIRNIIHPSPKTTS